MEGTSPETSNTVRRAGGLRDGVSGAMRWFAGVVGTIGVVLYGCGFLISIAQQHLLGLGRLVTYSHDEYVQQGGAFLSDISATIVIGAEPFSLVLVVLAMLWVGAASVWRRWAKRRPGWRTKIRRWLILARRFMPPVVYCVLVVLLLFRYGDPVEFGLPLTLSNILFVDPDNTAGPTVRAIDVLLMSGGKNGLAAIFEDRLFTILGVALLFLAANYVTSGQRWRRPAMVPFALLLVLYAFMLPMLFGVLKLHMEFPIVMLWPAEDDKGASGQRCLLLNMTDQVAVLYVPKERKILWRQRDHIARLDIIGIAPILSEIAVGKAKP